MSKSVDVAHLAKLTNIPISENEVSKFAAQFSTTLDTISTLESLDTTEVIATPQVTKLENIYREDEIDQSRQFTQAEALANTSKSHRGYFVVPVVLHES